MTGKRFKVADYKAYFAHGSQFKCKFCSKQCHRPTGLGKHLVSAHAKEWAAWRQEHGYGVSARCLELARATKANGHPRGLGLRDLRAAKQLDQCGVNLTRLNLGQLESLSRALRGEVELRFKQWMAHL